MVVILLTIILILVCLKVLRDAERMVVDKNFLRKEDINENVISIKFDKYLE